MSPYSRVSLVLVGCLMVYGFGLYTFNKEYLSQTQTKHFNHNIKTFSNGDQPPTYPSGYSTGIIEFLHDLPRSTYAFKTVDNTFYPAQADYWYGAAYLGAWILAVGIIITFLCGIPCCICGATNCCGKGVFDQNKAGQIILKIFLVLALVLAMGALVVAIVANVEANNEFIPVIEIPDKLLNGINQKLVTIETEATTQNIPIPDEITNAQKTIDDIQGTFDTIIPDIVEDIFDEVYNVRGYAFIIVFIFGIVICVAGVVCAFLVRGNNFTIWLGFVFLSFFTLVIIVAPLLMINTVAADICIDSNDIIIRPISDNTTRDLAIFYLFCPEDYTPDLEFVDQLVNDTQTVLTELEEGREEALEETDTELVAVYDVRIQQTENLLTLEQTLYFCNATSEDYNDFLDEICMESLKWNWVLMWLLFVALIFQIFAMCLGFSAIFVLPKQTGYFVLE